MNEILRFHNLSTIFIASIGAILLLAIYFNIRKRFRQLLDEETQQSRVDKGLLNLGLAMVVWVGAGVWALAGEGFGFTGSFVDQLGIHLLSTLNNMFLLFAVSYFVHAPDFISNSKKNVRVILGIIIAVAALTLLFVPFDTDSIYKGVKLLALPDLILSGFICWLLLVSMYRTFRDKDLHVVALISVVMVVLMFLSQLPQALVQMNDDFYYSLIRIVAKTSLVSLFLLLATTWVIDLAHTPRVKEMKIRFLDWSLVELSIPSKDITSSMIDFGSKTTQYKNLLKLAIRRKYAIGDEQSILVNSAGEIKSQTYLSRIIDNINAILNLEGEQMLHRRDLFTFLGESRYRLRILPEMIEVDADLLREFLQKSDNQSYKAICDSL